MAYAFAGNSFKAYHYRPNHWAGEGSAPPTPTFPPGRTVYSSASSGSVVDSRSRGVVVDTASGGKVANTQ